MKWFALFGLVALIGCSKQSESPRVEINWRGAVIGKDDRIKGPMETGKGAVGRIWTTTKTSKGRCVGTLVSRFLVLTNKHCVPYDIVKVEFSPEAMGTYEEAEKYSASVVEVGTQPDVLGDWAILKLDKPAGDSVPPMQIETFVDDDLLNENLKDKLGIITFAISKSKTERRLVQTNCSAKFVHADGMGFMHTCDSDGPGSSGSPLTYTDPSSGETRIVGLYIGGPDPKFEPNSKWYFNTGISSVNFSAALLKHMAEEKTGDLTQVTYCNHRKEMVYFAIAYFWGGWRTRAWIPVKPEECKDHPVTSIKSYSGQIWIAGVDSSYKAVLKAETKAPTFCLSSSPIKIRADKSCETNNKEGWMEFTTSLDVAPTKANRLEVW